MPSANLISGSQSLPNGVTLVANPDGQPSTATFSVQGTTYNLTATLAADGDTVNIVFNPSGQSSYTQSYSYSAIYGASTTAFAGRSIQVASLSEHALAEAVQLAAASPVAKTAAVLAGIAATASVVGIVFPPAAIIAEPVAAGFGLVAAGFALVDAFGSFSDDGGDW